MKMMKAWIVSASLAGMLVGCFALNYEENLVGTICDKFTECEADVVGAYVAAGMDDASAQATFDTAVEPYCSWVDDGEDSDCDFQKSEAKDCVSGWESLTCDQLVSGDLPTSCDNVCAR